MSVELLEGMYRLLGGLEERELSESLLEESGFARSLEEIGIRQKFEIETIEGRKVLTNGDRPVDLLGAIRSIENYGDITSALVDLNVPSEIIESGPVQRYSASYRERWARQPGNLDIELVQEFDATGDAIEAETGAPDPTSVQDVDAILRSNETLAKKFSEKVDALKRKLSGGDRVSVGTWVKRGLTFGAGLITAGLIYTEIMKHKMAMNGCWLVDIRTGQKCKISTMTCTGKRDDGDTSRDKSCGEFNVCGRDGLSPCFETTTCTRRNAATGACVETIGKCSTGTCHSLCTFNTSLRLPPGKRLQCVSVNFWGAAEDFFDSVLGTVFDRRFLLVAGAMVLVIAAILFFSR